MCDDDAEDDDDDDVDKNDDDDNSDADNDHSDNSYNDDDENTNDDDYDNPDDQRPTYPHILLHLHLLQEPAGDLLQGIFWPLSKRVWVQDNIFIILLLRDLYFHTIERS